MKWLTLLLFVYVLLLSVNPCCTDNCSDERPVKEATDKKAPIEKECPGCSPFFSCSTCVGFVASDQVVFRIDLAVRLIKHVFFYKQQNLRQAALPIWQPPQLS